MRKLEFIKQTYLNLCYLVSKSTPNVKIIGKGFSIEDNPIIMTEFTMLGMIKDLTNTLLDNR